MKAEERSKGQKYGTLSTINHTKMTSPFIIIFKRMGLKNLKGSLPLLINTMLPPLTAAPPTIEPAAPY